MAIRIFPPNFWNIIPPGVHVIDTGLITTTYTRKLTYGQINGIKGIMKLMKRLKVSKKLEDVRFNQTDTGGPGSADTYRVRIRYRD